MQAQKSLTIGIIGTRFGKIVAQIFKTIDPTSHIFLAGNDYEKTKGIVKKFSFAGAYPDWQSLITDPKIDLVVIASPSHLHSHMFELAVAHKKHILVEKPAALTSTDIEKMQQMTKKYNKLVVVNHEARFHPVILHFRKLIQEGSLGTILTIRTGAYLNLFTNPDYLGSWYNEKAKGGGQIFAIATHQIDLARFLLGMPEVIAGDLQTSTFQDPRFTIPVDAGSQFTGYFMTNTKVSLQIFNDTYCFGYKDFTIDVIGSKGIALYRDTTGLQVSFANTEPPKKITFKDPLADISLGNSLLTQAMKYFTKELLQAIKNNGANNDFCTLAIAKENLAILERY